MQDSDFTLLDQAVIPEFPAYTQFKRKFHVITSSKSSRHPGSRRGRIRNGEGFLNSPPVRRTYRSVVQSRVVGNTVVLYPVAVPRITGLQGTWNFGDMLNDDSIGNLLRAYAEIKGR